MSLSDLMRLYGMQDSRSRVGRYSRGSNVYQGALPNPSGAGAPNQFRIDDPTWSRPTGTEPQQMNRISQLRGVAGSIPPQGAYPQIPQEQMGFPIWRPQGAPTQTPQNDLFSPEELQRYMRRKYTAPTDPGYEFAKQDIERQRASGLLGYQTATQRLGEDYNTYSNQLQEDREAMLRRLTENMASQGIIRSGIYLGEQGRIGDEYQEQVNQLNTQRQRASQDIETEWARQQAEIENLLAEIERERTRRAEAAAQESAMRQALAITSRQAQNPQQPVAPQPSIRPALPVAGSTMPSTQPQVSPVNVSPITERLRRREPLRWG